jgi:N-acetyltransferase 10
VQSELAKGSTPSGDLIPWTLSQQYNDSEFPRLSGARIVRVATNPDVQGMGYGSRALELIGQFFSGELSQFQASGDGIVKEPSEKESSLLIPLRDRPAERLHWLGSSFGLTSGLHKFWKRQKYVFCSILLPSFLVF